MFLLSSADVMDVAWSPHDVWLASCSVDNTIVIWNARKFPGRKTRLVFIATSCLSGFYILV